MSFLFIRDHDGSYDYRAMACHVQRRAKTGFRLAAQHKSLITWTMRDWQSNAIAEVVNEAKAERQKWLDSRGGGALVTATRRALRPAFAAAALFAACFVVGFASEISFPV